MLSDLPTTGTAIYNGRIGIVYQTPTGANGFGTGINLAVDFAAQTVSGSSFGIAVDGDIAGKYISGTVTYNGNSAEISGGFTGLLLPSILAGGFAGPQIAGAFLTNAP